MSANGTSPAPAAARTGPTPAATEEAADRSRGRRHRPRAAPPAVAPPRTRRRTGVLAAGVALVALGALGAAYLAQTVGGTVAVLAVVRDVAPGQVVQAADLTIADINTDPALSPVPADRLQSVIGQRAAAALTDRAVWLPHGWNQVHEDAVDDLRWGMRELSNHDSRERCELMLALAVELYYDPQARAETRALVDEGVDPRRCIAGGRRVARMEVDVEADRAALRRSESGELPQRVPRH